MIERQLFTAGDILWEHQDGPWLGARIGEAGDSSVVFRAFRRRLLRQMERRRWGAALTDFTIAEFFCLRPPALFVAAMSRLLGCLEAALEASRPHVAVRQPTVASLYREGTIRLIFKGGNPQALMRLRCLELLPPAAQRALGCIRPAMLSDIDVMLALDQEAPCFREVGVFERVHRECTQIVEEALRNLVMDVQASLRRGCGPPPWQLPRRPLRRPVRAGRRGAAAAAPSAQPPSERGSGTEVFARLLRSMFAQGGNVEDRATARVGGAGAELRASLAEALRGYGLCPGDVLAQLGPERGFCVRPCRRKSRRIAQDSSGRGIELLCYGPPSQLFVSSSSHVEFKDVRCIEEGDMCRFGLVRLFLGFRLDFKDAEGANAVKSRYSRGEVFDVSIPKREDISLKLMCQHERRLPGSTITLGELSAGRESVRLHVLTLDALIDENYDLTFGRNAVMDDPCIWRIPKVRKRLVRLMELLGIKVFTLPGHSWGSKSEAFARLAVALREFCGGTSEKEEEEETRAQAAVGTCQVCVESRIEGCLVRGLRILARALKREKATLPADAWKQIGDSVAPVAELAAQFAVACSALEGRPSGSCEDHVKEEELYQWRLGDVWPLRAEEQLPALAATPAAPPKRRRRGSADDGASDASGADADAYSGEDPCSEGPPEQRSPRSPPSKRRRRKPDSHSNSRGRSRSTQAPSRSSFSWA